MFSKIILLVSRGQMQMYVTHLRIFSFWLFSITNVFSPIIYFAARVALCATCLYFMGTPLPRSLVFLAPCGGVSIISFTSIIGAPVGIESASLTLFFSLKTGIFKKLLTIKETKRKSMIKFLCWLKVNSIALKL